jgi:predicted dienelactone hydrolase
MKVVRIVALCVVLTVGNSAPAFAGEFAVGHRVEQLTVEGVLPGSVRPVKVHLWYPADQRAFSEAPETVYTSALYGRPLPGVGDPLGWKVKAEIARETGAVDRHGKSFPVIVFSHGSVNDPIDYAHTLELIAAEGFVVAAPYHVNNTQDDVRTDLVNGLTALSPVFPTCADGLAWNPPSRPCSRIPGPPNIKERVRDISSILDALPDWFGDRVDAERAGVLGHSRGTVTALAAAGGSSVPADDGNVSGFAPEPRVDAIMGLAVGARMLTSSANLANVTVPTVLVAGGLDQNTAQALSEEAFAAISSADKLFVGIPKATHRSFDSTYCAQLQSAGAIAQANEEAVLDLHSVRLIAASAPGGRSGKAVHYCAAEYFTSPVDIRPLVTATAGAEFPPSVGPSSVCLSTSIPCTGLDTEEVKQGVKDIAATFFGTALKRQGNDGIHFARHLAPRWLMKHVPMVGSARAYAGPDSICPPGQGVNCAE